MSFPKKLRHNRRVKVLARIYKRPAAPLRTAELLRLTWQDVWPVENHIEITAGKAKTRQRLSRVRRAAREGLRVMMMSVGFARIRA